MEYVNYEPICMSNTHNMLRWWLGEEFCKNTVRTLQFIQDDF